MWIFGYGSLTWKADFEYMERVVGYIKGYSRRFWQASIDHRGVPEKPGRVVTLVPSDSMDVVWGVAYRVDDSLLAEGSSLNMREKTYQERREVPVYTRTGEQMSQLALVFLGTSQEKLRLGPAPLEEIAEQIVSAVGPSGSNIKYLLNLAEFMRKEVPQYQDKHLMDLEQLVIKWLKENEDKFVSL